MALPNAVVGATYIPATITWTDEDGTAINLAGATLTGTIESWLDGSQREITGTLTVTNAANGVFQWDYSAGDVLTAGMYFVQFTADFGGELHRSSRTSWKVEPGFEVV
jgi:hypothetical protein